MPKKQKVTIGANDRPKDETIAQTAPGLLDDSSRPVQVDEATMNKTRAKFEDDKSLRRGDEIPKDQSSARQKDRARSEPETEGRTVRGAEEVEGAGAEEDTYD